MLAKWTTVDHSKIILQAKANLWSATAGSAPFFSTGLRGSGPSQQLCQDGIGTRYHASIGQLSRATSPGTNRRNKTGVRLDLLAIASMSWAPGLHSDSVLES